MRVDKYTFHKCGEHGVHGVWHHRLHCVVMGSTGCVVMYYQLFDVSVDYSIAVAVASEC